MPRYRDMVLAVLLCRETKMTAGPAWDVVAEGSKREREVLTGHIARQLHAGRTSSRTK